MSTGVAPLRVRRSHANYSHAIHRQAGVPLSPRRLSPCLLLSLCILSHLLCGCDRKELEKLTQQVKEATVEKVETALPQVKPKPVGELQIATNPPVSFTSVAVTLLSVGDGRPNVVQIRPAADIAPSVQGSYPDFLIQAETPASSLSQLIGQTLPVNFFLQTSASGPISYSIEDRPVTLTFDRQEETELIGRINSGALIGTDGQELPIGGSFRAIMMPSTPEIRSSSNPSAPGSLR